MSKSKRKGYMGEWKLIKLFQEHQIEAKRVPYSGALKDDKGDVVLPNGEKIEVKVRKNGFNLLYKWLENADYLAVKHDRYEYLVVMPLSKFVKLIKNIL